MNLEYAKLPKSIPQSTACGKLLLELHSFTIFEPSSKVAVRLFSSFHLKFTLSSTASQQHPRAGIRVQKLISIQILRPRHTLGIPHVIPHNQTRNHDFQLVARKETARACILAVAEVQVVLIRGSELVLVRVLGFLTHVVVAQAVEGVGIWNEGFVFGCGF